MLSPERPPRDAPRPDDESQPPALQRATIRRALASLKADEARLSAAIRNLAERVDLLQSADLLSLICHQAELASRRTHVTRTLFEWVDTLLHIHADTASRLDLRIREHDRTLKDACNLIRELDDPYGFGASLDERLLSDEDPFDQPSKD